MDLQRYLLHVTECVSWNRSYAKKEMQSYLAKGGTYNITHTISSLPEMGMPADVVYEVIYGFLVLSVI